MDKLKPCPLCGAVAEISPYGGGEWVGCTNKDCELCGCDAHKSQWNNRPIEDALHTRLTASEEDLDWICQCEALCHWYDYFKCHPLLWKQAKYSLDAHCEAYATRHAAFEAAHAKKESPHA